MQSDSFSSPFIIIAIIMGSTFTLGIMFMAFREFRKWLNIVWGKTGDCTVEILKFGHSDETVDSVAYKLSSIRFLKTMSFSLFEFKAVLDGSPGYNIVVSFLGMSDKVAYTYEKDKAYMAIIRLEEALHKAKAIRRDNIKSNWNTIFNPYGKKITITGEEKTFYLLKKEDK